MPTIFVWRGHRFYSADGSEPVYRGKYARYALKQGDVVRLITGSGGGWGDPKERDRELVEADLRAGLISEETAREVYGIG